MPDIHRTQQQPLSTPLGPRPAPPRPMQPTPPAAGPAPSAPDLTTTKVLASAGAAATAAVFGSFFGATGTVTGAALGSVVSTIGASIYQRSLDRTRERVRARVRLPGERSVAVTGNVEVPAPRAPGDAAAATVHVSPLAPAQSRSGPRWMPVGAATVLAFVLGLLAITGVEWIAGSTLNAGQPGTSVGRVLDGGAPAESDSGSAPADERSGTSGPTESDESPGTTTQPGESPTPTRSPSESPSPSRTSEPPAGRPGPNNTAPVPSLELLGR